MGLFSSKNQIEELGNVGYTAYDEKYTPFQGGLVPQQEQAISQMISGELSPAQMQQLQKAYGVASQRILEQQADLGGTTGGIGSLQQRALGDFTGQMGVLGSQQRQAGLGFAQPFTEFQAGEQGKQYQYGLQEHQVGEQTRIDSERSGIQAKMAEDQAWRSMIFGGAAQMGGTYMGAKLGGKFLGGVQNLSPFGPKNNPLGVERIYK